MALPGPVLLDPHLERYAWGDRRFLQELLGRQVDGPLAEAWYGSHPKGPASVGGAPLDRLLREHGEAPLPYLLKILAVARPLSIQAHPNRAQAEAGFAREEATGLSRLAPNRSYRDPNPKPELVIALTPFEALGGFRAPDTLAALLRDALPEVAALLPPFDGDLGRLLAAYFALPVDRLQPALAAALPRIEARGDLAGRYAASARTAEGVDRGLPFLLLLEPLSLSPGEGLHLEAGVLHAYLSGCAVEVMASSDNVLRAGLTEKHVDPEELLRIVRLDRRPSPVRPSPDGRYPTPGGAFAVERIADTTRTAEGLETLLSIDGATVHADGPLALPRGGACLVPRGTTYRVEGAAFRVRGPRG
jgi:mannose-6-phosphate isomerase class I